MESETKQKIKKFYQKYKTEIIVTGVVIGGVILAYSLKPKIREVQILPEWARKWRVKCDTENLLYENGLPIFANEDMTAAYRDAFANEEAIAQWLEDGLEVVDRA